MTIYEIFGDPAPAPPSQLFTPLLVGIRAEIDLRISIALQ